MPVPHSPGNNIENHEIKKMGSSTRSGYFHNSSISYVNVRKKIICNRANIYPRQRTKKQSVPEIHITS